MITMRLKKLVESKCDELAVRFCGRALVAIRECSDTHALRQTVSVRQHQIILEAYFALLLKFKKMNELKQELEKMDFNLMGEFILNYINTINATEENTSHTIFDSSTEVPKKNPVPSQSQAVPSNSPSATNKCISNEQNHSNRLHKYLVKVNEFALQLFVLRILNDSEFAENTHRVTLQQFLTIWIDQHKHEQNFGTLFKKLIANSRKRPQMYISCEILYNQVSIRLP